jgi:hypothetical protein
VPHRLPSKKGKEGEESHGEQGVRPNGCTQAQLSERAGEKATVVGLRSMDWSSTEREGMQKHASSAVCKKSVRDAGRLA